MTIEELMKFKGTVSEFQEYQNCLQEVKKIRSSISRLSDQIQDEEDALDLLSEGASSEDKVLFERHLRRRRSLLCKRTEALSTLNTLMDRVHNMQN